MGRDRAVELAVAVIPAANQRAHRARGVERDQRPLRDAVALALVRQLIGKRLFEAVAGIKLLFVMLGGFLAVAVPGGVLLLFARKNRPRLLAAALPLLLFAGIFVAYAVFIPYKAQAGSLKKGILMLLPLLIPLGACALEEAVADKRIRRGAMVLALGLLAFFAADLVRLDGAQAEAYLASMRQMAAQAQTLPDTNGDGELRFMAQDPFMLRFAGLRSIMYPNEDLDTTIEIARRYGIDYIAGDDTSWEREPLEALACEGRLAAYRHRGFWQNMDTLRDKIQLVSTAGTGTGSPCFWISS